MASLDRHVFSKDEISKLEGLVKKANFEMECAQKALGQLRQSKLSLDFKHKREQHKYRLTFLKFTFWIFCG